MSDALVMLTLPPPVSSLRELARTPGSGIVFAPLQKSVQPLIDEYREAAVWSTYRLDIQSSGMPSWKGLPKLLTALRARNTYQVGISATSASIEKLNLCEELSSYSKLPQNWDGEGASPASQAAVDDALTFLDQKPADIGWPYPEEGTDGDVGLYWDYNESSVFAEVIFEGDRTYAYFAVHGVPGAVIEKSGNSSMDVNSAWPDEMLRILRIRKFD